VDFAEVGHRVLPSLSLQFLSEGLNLIFRGTGMLQRLLAVFFVSFVFEARGKPNWFVSLQVLLEIMLEFVQF
jgi:hypothetical protein